MSVIASFIVNGCPVIIGDLLVSGKEDTNKTLYIPTIGDVKKVFPEGSGFVPIGLEQKVIVIDDNLVLAWAGTVYRAKAAIATLIDVNNKRKFTPDTLWKLIQEMENDPDYEGVSLIAIIGDGVGIHRYCLRATYLVLDRFGETFIAGTGSESFLGYMRQIEESANIFELDPISAAIAVSINIFGMLVSDEMMDPSTNGIHSLHQFFGSGYEVAVFLDKKVRKIDDIIFTYWIAEQSEDGVKLNLPPHKMYKYYYIDECLYIYCNTFTLKKAYADWDLLGAVDNKRELHVVYPIWGSKSKTPDTNEPDLFAIWNVSFILFIKKDGTVTGLTRLDYRPDRDSPIKISNDKIEVDNTFINDLMSDMYNS